MTAPIPGSTEPLPQSAPLLEPPPPPILAPPVAGTLPPPPPESPVSAPQLPPIADALVMLGGLMILGFSFAPFVRYSGSSSRLFQQFTIDRSAWEWSAYLAPLTWFAVLGGVVLIALGLNHILSGEQRLLTFSVSQLQIVVAAYSASILIGYALADKSTRVGVSAVGSEVLISSGDLAWGGVLMLVGSLLAVVGAVINMARRPASSYLR